MTDTTAIAASAPLKITIYPQSAPPSGNGSKRVVNANATPGNVPNNPQFWGQNGFSFKSFLDTINPLQHIPVISTLYQAATGDIPSSGSNITGGLLFGGPAGMIASIANEAIKTQTGNDIGGNMLALAKGNQSIQTAQNTAAGAPFLSASQRTAYNAYVSSSRVAQNGGTGSITA